MKNNFVKQEYHPSLINEHLKRISLLNKIDLITKKDMQEKSDRMPLVITYNWFLLNTAKTIRKNWNTLQINQNFKEIFKIELIAPFIQNKNIQEIIGTHWIENVRVQKDLKTLSEGNCTPCSSKAGHICWKQVKIQQHLRANKQTKLRR